MPPALRQQWIDSGKLSVVQTNLPAFFSASTHWHPADGKPGAPHEKHREVLGGYEAWFDRAIHRWPARGVGLYWLLLPIAAWAGVAVLRELWSSGRAARGLRSGAAPATGASPVGFALSSRGLLLLLCLVQVGFVGSVSVLMTAQESSRYRFVVEPCIWALGAAAVFELFRWARSAVGALFGRTRSQGAR